MPRAPEGTPRLMDSIASRSSDRSIEKALHIGPAQLTIFYSGRVNVYDDVPADKAHAIMLLLSNGNGSMSRPSPESVQAIDAKPIGTNTPNSVGGVMSRSFLHPRPAPSTTTQVDKKQLVIKRSQAELPFARKASLARFLEKRKDRVEANLVTVNQTSADEDSGSPSKKIKL